MAGSPGAAPSWAAGLAVGLVALLAGGFLVSRKLGIGPGSTLMSAGVLAAQDRIILVEFENRTSDSTLGASVTEALRIDLGQSNVMRLMEAGDLQAALQRMGRPADATLDVALASDVARREGIKAIITGEITSLGSGYSLAARVINASTGETLVPIRATAADASQLIAAVDRLSKELREKVGESLGRIRGGDRLEQVTTSSLEALRLYSEAVREHSAGRSEEAVKLLRQAVAVDSTFAMAWRKLAVVRAAGGHRGRRRGDGRRQARLPVPRPAPAGRARADRGLLPQRRHRRPRQGRSRVPGGAGGGPRRTDRAQQPRPAPERSQGRAAEAEPMLRHLVATAHPAGRVPQPERGAHGAGQARRRRLGAGRIPAALAGVHPSRRHGPPRVLHRSATTTRWTRSSRIRPSGSPRRRRSG